MSAVKVIGIVAFLALAHGGTWASAQNEAEPGSAQTRYLLQGPEDSKEVLLYRPERPDDKVLLCKTHGWGGLVISFSPNEEWVVVQDGGASLGIYLRLFHRKEGLAYDELKEADIGGKAESKALKEKFIPDTQILEHRYVHVLPWSADSKMFLIELSGQGTTDSGRVAVSRWIGIYNVAAGTISVDLRTMNSNAVQHPR